MKTVALIPIKLGSKRVPGKNIKPFFDGTPLMHFIQKACLKAENIDEVYIYCSDDAVQEYVLPGVKYLKRPEFLDGDDKNANDIIGEFMKHVDADIYVNAHTTFMWQDGKPINFNPDYFPRTQDLPLIYGETSIAYVFTKESFLKHHRRLGIHPFIKEVDKIEAMDIDYPEDFEICNAIYKEMLKK